MDVKQIYKEELQIAQALIKRNEKVTKQYFYQKCYPLFKSIYDNYYTDCTCCKEFIDEMYIVVLAPSKKTGKCQMENFKGESTLASWIKTSCLYFCYKQYKIKNQKPTYENLPHSSEKENGDATDRNEAIYGSIEIDFSNLNREDAMKILKAMPNKRYSELIRLRYLKDLSNEETAQKLGMTMDNYYNKHKLAKEQYERICRKEDKYV